MRSVDDKIKTLRIIGELQDTLNERSGSSRYLAHLKLEYGTKWTDTQITNFFGSRFYSKELEEDIVNYTYKIKNSI